MGIHNRLTCTVTLNEKLARKRNNKNSYLFTERAELWKTYIFQIVSHHYIESINIQSFLKHNNISNKNLIHTDSSRSVCTFYICISSIDFFVSMQMSEAALMYSGS
jgi:hypothetical protein